MKMKNSTQKLKRRNGIISSLLSINTPLMTTLIAVIMAIMTVTPFTTFAYAQEEILWGEDDAIFVSIDKEHIEQTLADIPASFSYLDLKSAYIVDMSKSYMINLVLVLKNGGKEMQEKAIELIMNDDTKKNACKTQETAMYMIPFESIRDMSLVAPSNTAKVGETFNIKAEGEYKIYKAETRDFEKIIFCISDYDPDKVYTLDDFSQFGIDFTEITDFDEGWVSLKLAQPGFFNIYKAIDVLADNLSLDSIGTSYIYAEPTWYPNSDWISWSISDPTIADFVDKDSLPWCYNGEVEIKGLKQGTTTITYQHNFYDNYVISLDITVTENLEVITTETTPSTTTTLTANAAAKSTSDVPKGGVVLTVIPTLLAGVGIAISRKRR